MVVVSVVEVLVIIGTIIRTISIINIVTGFVVNIIPYLSPTCPVT